MNVLIACEFSGVVRDAFRKRGHNAYSCDLEPELNRSPYHYHCDVKEMLWGYEWDLMIAHPPCTHLAVSGARYFKDKQDLQKEALDFVRLLLDADIPKICLENPVSIISSQIRKPDQIIQPYQFGHDASKKTCLWLKNLPPLKPTKFVEGRLIDGKMRWSNQTDSGQNKLAPSKERAKIRAITYQGIADAMSQQWG